MQFYGLAKPTIGVQTASLSLTVHSALFSQKIVGIKHMPLHTTILVSNALTLAWGLVPRGLPCSVHLKLMLWPVMLSARSQGKSRGLCVTVKSLFFSLSSFSRPFGSSLGCTELSQIVFFVPWIRAVSVDSLKKHIKRFDSKVLLEGNSSLLRIGQRLHQQTHSLRVSMRKVQVL